MSVLDNVVLGAHRRGIRAGCWCIGLRLDRREERACSASARQLERVGLAEHGNDEAGILPLGQQRLLEIARALASDPASAAGRTRCRAAHLEKQALADLLR